MRRLGQKAGAFVVLVCMAAAPWLGCLFSTDFNDCAEYPHAGCGAGAGGGGGTPAACVPSENADAVGDACGVFVSSSQGTDTNGGSKGAPVQTIGAAVALAQQKGARVYACAETFDEAIEVPAGMTIFGGLDCPNGWRWIGETTKTTVTAAEGEIPLRLRGGEGAARLEDVAVAATSIDPTNAALRGASSIAALAEGIGVEMARCELTAGDGAPGGDGAAYAMERWMARMGLRGTMRARRTLSSAKSNRTTAARPAIPPMTRSAAVAGPGSIAAPAATAATGSR